MAFAPSIRHANHSDVLEALARLGYAAKGVLYLFVGVLATMYAAGEGGALIGKHGAFREVLEKPFGEFLLWVIAIGLVGFAIWRFVQAAVDPDSNSHDAKRILKRVGYAGSGVIHAALAVAAFQLVTGNGGGGDHEKTYVAKLLAMPGGTVLGVIAAFVVFGVAGYQIYKGYTAHFMKELSMGPMSTGEMVWAKRTGRFGLMAHGVVLAVIGWFLLQAAASGRAGQAKDGASALREIGTGQGGSTWLLAVVAIGLIAYAAHMFFMARYRRINVAV